MHFLPNKSNRRTIAVMKILLPIFCFCLVGLSLTGCASQKDVIILDERLMVLERQNQELQRQNSALQNQVAGELEHLGKSSQNAETNLRGQYAGINADMDKLRQDLILQSGHIDEISHLINGKVASHDEALKQDQEKIDALNLLVAKMDQRLADIERYLNLDRSEGKPSGAENHVKPSAASPQAAGKGEDGDQLYADAKQAYDNGQMEKARQGFQQLIKSFPKSSKADNAQFWIGETYYNEKWYEKAILEYQTVIEKYPKGNKVVAAMLKQGMSFLQLGDKSNARLIFKELEKKYPGSNEAAIATKKLGEL